ncbi:DUF2931 family protein [Pseudomonas sp. KFB-139]|uniref:DUF2931 family protein n=1 Tax=Pseudomonas serbiensis TaxID=3064350 RepID=A0ABT9CKI3_9PSED|nr:MULTISPECIES: DUF2931 family protein [Pseudomonas]MDO7925992.1 DUF2931 family protein [Pseudomonas sp. KFB-138]
MNRGERNTLVVLALAMLLLGCSGTNSYGAKLPYDSWRLGFFAPDYMEVWIETADVVDMQDRWFKRAMSGLAAIQTPPNMKGNPNGWPKRAGAGSGKQVTGADLPRFIYVRWQSLAEPQTYQAYIEIPESIRQAMREGGKTYCKASNEWITDYRENLAIGLAPGGIAKTWIRGTCLGPIEVSRVQGTIFKKGPDLGRTNGRYAFELEPESQAYIDKFGIPYDSW